MIKKLLFTLTFISVSIWFVKADIWYVWTLQNLNLTDTTVNIKWNFLSEFWWLSFNMFTFWQDNYFFWPSDEYNQYWLFYTKFCWENNWYRCHEWFNNYFYVCDTFTPDNYTNHWANCIPQTDENLLINILNWVDNTQYRYYIHSDVWAFWRLCFSSNVWNSICLSQEPYWNHPASNSLSLGNFSDVSSSYIWISPAGWLNNNTVSSDVYLCPTVWQLLSSYDSSIYNTWLCYSSSLILSWWSIISLDPVSLFDLFNSRSDFISYSDLYNTYCNNFVVNWSQCFDIFSWLDLQYSLLSKAYSNNNVNPSYLYQYCNLSLNYDSNTSTCVWSWIYINPWEISADDIISSVIWWDYFNLSQLPSSWSNVSEVLSWDYYTWDFISSLDDLWNKFTWLFWQQVSNNNWVLPFYIIWMFLLVVLFKFFKK